MEVLAEKCSKICILIVDIMFSIYYVLNNFFQSAPRVAEKRGQVYICYQERVYLLSILLI